MPHVVIFGMPPMLHRQDELMQLINHIRRNVAQVESLKLTEGEVTVNFPTDQCLHGLGEELVTHVTGLVDKPGRDEATIGIMNEHILGALLTFVHDHLPTCNLIEVFLPDRPNVGYKSWRK